MPLIDRRGLAGPTDLKLAAGVLFGNSLKPPEGSFRTFFFKLLEGARIGIVAARAHHCRPSLHHRSWAFRIEDGMPGVVIVVQQAIVANIPVVSINPLKHYSP